MSILSALSGKGPSGFGYASTAEDVSRGLDLKGKTYLITGCNSGIGLETARVLVMRGAFVWGAARTLEKAQAVCRPLGDLGQGVECELSEPKSVRDCVATLLNQGVQLDGIICNAGIMALPRLTIKHGVELQFLTNHIGHFILTTGLLPALKPKGRVVMVSSAAHRAAPRSGIQFDNLAGEKKYSPWGFYGQTKLANILFVKELAKRFTGSQRIALAVHPGVIATQLVRNMGLIAKLAYTLSNSLFLKNIPQGAATQTFAATHPTLRDVSGEYLISSNIRKCSAYGRDPELAAKLWSESERIVASFS